MERGRKILVVDDDPDIVESVRLVLEASDYQVATASNAEEGLAEAQTGRPDLILLDIMMPEGTEGFQFVWTLRASADSNLKNTPIVVLSAIRGTRELRFYSDQEDITDQQGEHLPVQGFIDKPVEPRELLVRLQKVLGG